MKSLRVFDNFARHAKSAKACSDPGGRALILLLMANAVAACNSQLSSLVVPNLTTSLYQLGSHMTPFNAPIESIPGSCGPIVYYVTPNPELFIIYGESIGPVPGNEIAEKMLGTTTHTLIASYVQFPTTTTNATFTLTVEAGAQLDGGFSLLS